MTNRLSPANLAVRSAAFAHALTARLPVHPLSPFRQRRSGVTSALKPASLLLAAAVLLAILAVDAGSISTAEAQDATITSLLSRLDVRVVSSGTTTQNAGYDAADSPGSLSPAGFNYPAGFGPWYTVEALAVNQGTTSNPISVVISVRGTVTSVASSGTHRARVLPSGASITLHLEGENFSKSYSLKNPNERTVTKCVDVDQEGKETERHCRVGETTTEEYDWTTNLPPRLAHGDKVIVRLRYSAPRPGKPGTPTVTAPTGKSGALVVEWTVPMIPDPDSMDESDMIPDPKVRGYEVHVSPAAGETDATGVTRTTGGSTTRLPVLLLEPDTAYNVRVRARTYLASGPWSDTATAMTNPFQGANNPQVELDLNDVTKVKQGDSLPLRLKVTGMPNLHAGAFPRQFEGHNQSHDVEFRVLGGIAEWYEFKDGGGGCGGGAFYGGGLTIGEDGEVYHDFGSLMVPNNKSDYGPLYIWLGSGCGAQPRSQFSIGSTANSRATALCVEIADDSNMVPTGRACSTEGSAGHAGDRLTGRFVNVPRSHDGENEFNFRLAFVEDVGISPTSLREDALTATGGAVTQVQRVDDRSDLFKITVEPDSDEDVTITLSSSGDCGEAGSICTQEEDPRKLYNSPTATVAGPMLTASFQGLPSQHDGETAFSFRIAFSDEIATDAAEFRDHSVEVWGGEVTRAEPVGQRRDLWEVEVEPASEDMVMVSLKPTQSCAATGAVCTAGGRLLSVIPATMVPGPATWPVRVTGEARVGKTLTADSSNLSERYGVQVTSMTYRWLADGARVPGANARTYRPDDDQQGKRISVMATYTDDRGNEETVTSGPTEPLAARDRIRRATALPLISGRALVGHTLTADTSLIIDPDGLENAVFHYFWEADDDSIPDATDPTYTPVAADVGKEITVIVAWVDDAGHGQTMTSQPTMPVMTAEAAAAVEFRKSLRVAANADGSVTLYWNAPDDEVTGYRILRHRHSLGELDPLVYVADTGSTTTTYTDTGMVAGVPHNYRVQAIRDGVLGERTIQIKIFPVRKATNSPATGAPAISGTAQVGETLTADISGIADEDGLENVTRNYLWAAIGSSGKIGSRYAYQWLVDGADSGSGDHHAGYDNTTYTPTEDDVGKAISVRVTFVDDGGYQETLTSAATDAVAALPQPNSPATGAPTIGGTAQEGETLTVDTSGITDEDGLDDSTFTVQWITDDSVMVASAARSYTPTGGDRGKSVKVRVSFTDDAGNRETRTSTQTAPIEGQANGQEGNSPATGAPVISGTAQVGETLTADTTGIADADGLTNVSFSYQWIRNDGTTDTDIQGATSSTYTLSDADEGKTIKVRVSFTDKGGYQETLTSTTTIIVDQPGTVSLWPEQPRVGTVVSATLTDSDGLEGAGSGAAASLGAVSWQWARSSEGSTWTSVDVYEDGDSYTPAEDDEGMWLKVTAVYTDGHGKGKSAEAITAATVGAREASPELTVTELVTGLTHPWDIAFTPDGTMLFTERDDGLRVRLTDGTVRQVTADFSDLNFGGTAGLLALVLDPDFVPNRRFYTYQRHTGAEMQVIAWTIDQDYIAAARVADPLVGGIPRNRNRGPSHGGGRLRFGPQGYLWIATGDGFSGTAAQDLTSLGGKVLRVDSQTGAGAPDNPFAPSPIYTYGHRNPQGLALRPGTSQMWSVEHGPDHDDEINLLVSGGNYGWDPAPDEGAEDLYDETTTPMTDLVKFPDGLEAKWSSGYPPLAVGGGVFLEGSQWREWEGRFAVATLKTKSVRVFKFTEEGDLVSQAVVPELDHTYGRLRTAVLGPDGALYITTTNGGSKDKILKVVPANTPATGLPTIDGTPQVGETLTVSTSSITDTDGMDSATFSYQWIANDGTTGADIEDATDSTYELSDDDVERTITVRVTFTDGGGSEETLTSAPTGPVLGDGPPGAPGNLAATPGNKEITLSWDPPADNGNAPATGYRIEWRVDGKDYDKNLWGTARSATYTTNDQANLANGVKYFFRVRAGNGSGNSYGPYGPASGEVSATPTSGSAVDLGTPVMLDTKTLHHGMVKLDWEDVEDAGWYVVQYYHVKGGEWLDLPAEGVDIAFHGSSAVVSNLHGLSWLRVRAMSCAGESEWSQIEQLFGTNASDWEGVPVPEVAEGDEIEPCPVVLGTPVLSDTETLHHGMVQLDWEDVEDAGWYVVQHYHVKGGEWLDLPAVGVDIAFHGSSAVVSNLHGLSWLRVRAMSCAGESEWSQIEQLFGTNASDWEGVPVPEVAEGDEIEPCSEDTDTPDNSPATGAPTISGTAQVGETLTANTSGIADADGLSSVQYEYQWLADDSDISGATNATYTPVAADEAKVIKVRVSFTDDADNEESLTSAVTAAVEAKPNTPAADLPTLSGLTLQIQNDYGDRIALTPETFDPGTTTYTVSVYNQTTSVTLTATKADSNATVSITNDDDTATPEEAVLDLSVGSNTLTVTVTAQDGTSMETYTVTVTRAAAPPAPPDCPAGTTWCTTAKVGYSSYAAPASYEGVSYQELLWELFGYQTQRDFGDLGSMTFSHDGVDYTVERVYRVKMTDVHNSEVVYETLSLGVFPALPDDTVFQVGTRTLTVGADSETTTVGLDLWDIQPDPTPSWTKDQHVTVSLTLPANTAATGAPTISGTARVGETLTADTSGIADADGLANATFTYQWLADDATGRYLLRMIELEGTYTIEPRDVGMAISVLAIFKDDRGNVESLESAPTGTVKAAPTTNSPATGAPAISGTAQVGETLTADTSGIADTDGLTNATFTYQWLASRDTEIAGATGSTYTLVAADEGKAITVQVSFTDDAGHEETLTSAATAAVAAKPNSPATGAPTIDGTVQVGEPLTANTSGVADADGLSSVQYEYQWLADDAEIAGATGLIYTVAAADEGKAITVQVSFTDDAGNGETLTSAATDAVAAAPTPNSPATGVPSVSGTAQVGETLTANTSGIADEDGLSSVQYEYQWLADDSDISGATNATYTPVAADEAKVIKVRVSFTDDADNQETLTSTATGAVDARPNSPATGAPTIAGTSQVGQTLTADTSGIADADGLANATFSYQWLAGDTEIAGATGLTYTLIDSEESKAITVQVSFTDDADNQETLTSGATDTVEAAPTTNSPATGAPTITGTAQVGETLTANTSGVADADGLDDVSFTYQWLADDSDISGATNATYTPVAVDEGKAIKVEVSFTDDAGNEETLTSEATDAVAAAEPSEPPSKPRGLEATASHGQVVLTWDNPQDDSITGYVILRRVRVNDQGGEFSVLVADTGSAATTYTDNEVAASTTYTYRIKAINEHGVSERSRWVHIDTPAPPVPDKPTDLEATASNGQVVLTWNDPDDDSITGYVILRRLPGVDPEGQFDELVADTGTAATTYTDATVAAETRYTYRIKAINEHGVSERSRWVHIDTPAAP